MSGSQTQPPIGRAKTPMRARGQTVKGRIAYFESLRGLAALVIVFYHLGADTPLIENNMVNNAWMMLDFFFILSGCVITMAFERQLGTPQGVGDFLYGRFLRVYPLHIVTLMIFVGLELIKLFGMNAFGISAENAPFSDNNLGTFLHNVFLTNVLLVDDLSWNKPAWSIAAEFWTYLIFALLALLFRNNRARFLSLCALIAFAAFVYLARHDMSSYHGMTRCLWGFFLGVLLAHLIDSGKVRVPTWGLNLAVIVCLIVLCTGPWSHKEPYSVDFTIVFFALLTAFFCSPDTGVIKRSLSHRWLVHLGTLSFGIYMLHSIVWWVLSQAARVVARLYPSLLESGGYNDVLENPVVGTIVLLIGLPIIIALAELSYRKLEMPLYNLRWVRPRWLTALPGTAAQEARR